MFTKTCPHLCELITDNGISKLATNLQCLKRFDLKSLENIGNSSLHGFSKYSKKLQNTHVVFRPSASNDGLKALLEDCSKLKYIDSYRTNVIINFV